VHSSTELRSEDFEIAIEGQRADLATLLPGFEEHSRIGIVVRDGFGAVGVSGLSLAAVTSFYDILRARSRDGFFRYADYFIFHVGAMHGSHDMLDISPDHKEVLVADDAEQILEAINDRGITHLVVPDREPGEPSFLAQTENGAMARLRAALVYSPGGRVADADVVVKGTERVDYYVRCVLDAPAWIEELEAEGAPAEVVEWARTRLGEVPAEVAEVRRAERRELLVEGRTVESLRRIEVAQALRLLAPASAGAAR
jgi:hypothetical protein